MLWKNYNEFTFKYIEFERMVGSPVGTELPIT